MYFTQLVIHKKKFFSTLCKKYCENHNYEESEDTELTNHLPANTGKYYEDIFSVWVNIFIVKIRGKLAGCLW